MIFNRAFIKNALPYLGSFIIALGIVKAYFYYKEFNILITEYLELGEALLLFSSDIMPLAIGLLLGIILNFLLYNNNDIKRVSVFDEKIRNTNSFLGRLKLYLKNYILIAALFFMNFIFWVVTFFIAPPNHQKFLIDSFFFVFSCLLLLLIVVEEFKIAYDKKTGKEMPKQNQGLIILVMALFIISIGSSERDAFFKKYTNDSLIYKMKLVNQKLLITSLDTTYLGKTKNYLFLYSKSRNESIVLKNESIESFSVESKK